MLPPHQAPLPTRPAPPLLRGEGLRGAQDQGLGPAGHLGPIAIEVRQKGGPKLLKSRSERATNEANPEHPPFGTNQKVKCGFCMKTAF